MPNMIQRFHKRAAAFLHKIDLRIWILLAVAVVCAGGLTYRLFQLQIVHGEEYLDNFQLKIRRQITLPGTRGNIYDRNGNLLAYNELAYSVTIRDTFGDSGKDKKLNTTIASVLDIIEKHGDTPTSDFGIVYRSGNYEFTSDGREKLRFLADVYGHPTIDELKYTEESKSAEAVVLDLAKRYAIGAESTPGDESTFIAGAGYTDDPQRLLTMVLLRYKLSLNSYQRYIATTAAFNVCDSTVSEILENSGELQGVDIEEDTVRRYTDAKYFAQLLGYTGKISTEELTELRQTNPDYDANDVVGKSGIEKSMEAELQGGKGSETVYVDNLGNLLETTQQVPASAGHDVYLTIDKDLQEAAYDILEKHLSQILLAKLRNLKEFTLPENASASKIVIPVYDVYYACFNNHIINIDHLSASDATETERAVWSAFTSYRSGVFEQLKTEMETARTPYDQLSREYKNYETYVVRYLYNNEVLVRSRVDTEDKTYQDWTTNETISMSEFLDYAIARNWIDVNKLDLKNRYSDSGEVFAALESYILDSLQDDDGFIREIFKYMMLADGISGEQVCRILMEQGAVKVPAAERAQFESGGETAYQFMQNRIANLDITPAQLALDPCTGSMVITDPRNGDTLAMVTYPGYDNNKMANTVDADYYAQLRQDLSSPLLNYATQQLTAPGSTFKPLVSTAALLEGAVDLSTKITCTGVFTKLGEPYPHCWVYPAAHGTLDLVGGIRHSCNDFFYEVGYRLGTMTNDDGSTTYDSDAGIAKLAKYADLYGLSETSGVEVEESAPKVSTEDAVRSSIGQGNSGYTTVQLARYVTTIANRGTCYDLTLIDRICSSDGTVLKDNQAIVRNTISMDTVYWDAIQEGMREVVGDMTYFRDLGVQTAGKTGTAQEAADRANHALFICFAPSNTGTPEIAIATRIANGYTSAYAAQTTEDVLKVYFGEAQKEDIMNSTDSVTTDVHGD